MSDELRVMLNLMGMAGAGWAVALMASGMVRSDPWWWRLFLAVLILVAGTAFLMYGWNALRLVADGG